MIDIMDSFIIIIIIILISFGFYSFILTLGTLDLIAVLSAECWIIKAGILPIIQPIECIKL